MSDRRQFLSSIFGVGARDSGENKPFFPPPPGFCNTKIDECFRCEDKSCKNSCPENIIILTQEGTPRLNLSSRGCTFCDDCATACKYGCFEDGENKKIMAVILIEILNCLAWNRTICRSCADVCNEKAIKFLGLFHPEINSEICTSCGFCIGVCPAQAVKIKGC